MPGASSPGARPPAARGPRIGERPLVAGEVEVAQHVDEAEPAVEPPGPGLLLVGLRRGQQHGLAVGHRQQRAQLPGADAVALRGRAARAARRPRSSRSASARAAVSSRAERTWSCHHWPGPGGVAVAEAGAAGPRWSAWRPRGSRAGGRGRRCSRGGSAAARAGSPSPRRRRRPRRRAAAAGRPAATPRASSLRLPSLEPAQHRPVPGDRRGPRTGRTAPPHTTGRPGYARSPPGAPADGTRTGSGPSRPATR